MVKGAKIDRLLQKGSNGTPWDLLDVQVKRGGKLYLEKKNTCPFLVFQQCLPTAFLGPHVQSSLMAREKKLVSLRSVHNYL